LRNRNILSSRSQRLCRGHLAKPRA
jgi:hypothetical protein